MAESSMSDISSKVTMDSSEAVKLESVEHEHERIDNPSSEATMEGVQASEDVGEDMLWLSDLDMNPEEAVPLETLDFGFGNFDLGFDNVDARVTNPVADAAMTIRGDVATVQHAVQEIQKHDVDREVSPIAGLRAAPHPELLQAGKGKEKSPSAHNDKWSLRRVDQLRRSLGWDMRTPFGDLPLDEIDELLSNLFARVVKVSGEEYPAASLMNMLGGYNRIIRARSDLRLVEKITFPPPVDKDFNIKKHLQFVKTRLVLKAALKKTAREGTNKKTAKVEIITEAMEEAILIDLDHQITDSQGCQKRLVMYLVVRCGIRGGKELWLLRRADLSVLVDNQGREHVQFIERHIKNNTYNLDRYAEHQFRKPYVSYEVGFVICVKQYFRHMPAAENSEPDLLLQPIVGPASIVWFNRVQKVGRDKCSGYLKCMATLVGICPDVFSNKSGRATLITRMATRGVPDEIGRLLSGHHTADGYLRYDRTQVIKMEAAALVAADPSYSYQAALAEVSQKFVEEKILGNRSDYHPLVAPGMCYNSEASSSDVVLGSSSNVASSSSNAVVVSNTTSSAALNDRVTGKAVALSMCNEVKVLQPTQQFGSGGNAQQEYRIGGSLQPLTEKNTVVQQQLTAWHRDYDNIDWEEECRKNPSLQRVLGGASGSGGGSQVAIGSRIGSSLAGNSFHLGANCTINFICDRKDEDKENKPGN